MTSLAAPQLGRPAHVVFDIPGGSSTVASPFYEIAGIGLGETAPERAFGDVHVESRLRFVTGYLSITREDGVLALASHGFPAGSVAAIEEALVITPSTAQGRLASDGTVRLDEDGLAIVAGAGTRLAVRDGVVTASGTAPHVYVVHGPSSPKLDERIALLHSLAATVGVPGPVPHQEI